MEHAEDVAVLEGTRKRARMGGDAAQAPTPACGSCGAHTCVCESARTCVCADESAGASERASESASLSAVDPEEAAVGITHFLTRSQPFTGILKHRFADFIVREIRSDGQVAALTHLGGFLPGCAAPQMGPVDTAALTARLEELLGEVAAAAVLRMQSDPEWPVTDVVVPAPESKEGRREVHATIRGLCPDCDSVGGPEAVAGLQDPGTHVPIPFVSKDMLTRAIRMFRRASAKRSSREAKDGDAGTTEVTVGDAVGAVGAAVQEGSAEPSPAAQADVADIRFGGRRGGRGGGRGRGRGRGHEAAGVSSIAAQAAARNRWPQGMPDYIRFVLCKRNCDTMSAISQIAKRVGAGESRFGFAGLKDRRGVTTQFVTGYRVQPDALRRASTVPGILVGNFEFAPDRLELGYLQGNEFTLAIRNIQADVGVDTVTDRLSSQARTERAVQAAMEAWAATHYRFINYYGLQRFGITDVPTHAVGKAILQGNYVDAVRLLMAPRRSERPDVAAARAYYLETGDAAGTLPRLPRFMTVESTLMRVMRDRAATIGARGAALQALEALPSRLRQLYVHAYQSYLWNKCVSRRLQMLNSEHVVAGDLVATISAILDDDAAEDEAADGGQEALAAGAEQPTVESSAAIPGAKLVTDADVAAGTYTMEDIVFPMIGADTLLPRHACGPQLVLQVLRDDGFTFPAAADADDAAAEAAVRNLFASQHAIFRMSGCYRHMVISARNVAWEIKRYHRADEPLVATDIDGARSASGASADAPRWLVTSSDETPAASNGDTHVAPYSALILRFTLSRSAYATMVLREIMKGSTGRLEHKRRTEEHQAATAATTPVEAPAVPAEGVCSAATENREEAMAATHLAAEEHS